MAVHLYLFRPCVSCFLDWGTSTGQATCVFVSASLSVAHNTLARLTPFSRITLPILSSMSPSSSAVTSSLNYRLVLDSALEAYRKKTKNDLASHPLLNEFESCDSPEAILTTLRRHILGFDQARSSNDKSTTFLSSTVKVFCAFSSASSAIGGGVGLVGLELTCPQSSP